MCSYFDNAKFHKEWLFKISASEGQWKMFMGENQVKFSAKLFKKINIGVYGKF